MLSKDVIGNTPSASGTRDARALYSILLESSSPQDGRLEARRFLEARLERASGIRHDFPAEPKELDAWMEQKAADTGARYEEYLESRRQGGPRLYFSNKAHALYFLQQAAPTKLVDGAWLYGVLPYWKDPRFHGLIRTYLEELGDGVPEQNHVVLYQRLLAANGCETLPPLTEDHYVRGAVQLAFAYNAEHFLPELVGYNLGYEQLPLHLLITAFELGELGIDPYYFTLHITIDNAGTGHARKAVQAVKACIPATGNAAVFWQRVINGYQLNDGGLGTNAIIKGFDLEDELVRVLERKREFGRNMHSDYSLFAGRTVNEWLSAPDRMREFLKTLEAKRWIIRHQDPRQSRFWDLIDGPKAPMAGVFDGYEKQLIHDWIAGDALIEKPTPRKVFRRYREPDAGRREPVPPTALDPDVLNLRRELRSLEGAQRMRHLIEFMSPAKHATNAGLLATREFVASLGNGPS